MSRASGIPISQQGQDMRHASPARPRLMREVLHLLRPFWKPILGTTIAGAIGGMAMAWSLSVINEALTVQAPVTGLLAFGALCVISLLGQFAAGIGNSILGQKIIARLRQDICRRILEAPLATVERAKAHRLLAILTGDVEKISEFAHHFAGYAAAFAIVAGCLVYLLHLSPVMLAFALGVVALGGFLNHKGMAMWLDRFEAARSLEDSLQKLFRSVVEGAKELRLNRDRMERLHRHGIVDLTNRIARLNGRAFAIFWAVDVLSLSLIFLIIGVILIIRPFLDIPNEAVTGFIIVMLFARGPVEELAGALPVFSQAQIAFRRISALSAEFSADRGETEGQHGRPAAFGHSIALRGVVHRLEDPATGRVFTLHVPNLDIRAGELVFIVGGNGSGKTTLVKLLLGLSTPASGHLLLDGRPLAQKDLAAYRQLFSAVFADFHLFEELAPRADTVARARVWLRRLDLEGVVDVETGRFSTLDLSTGQRKRLALINAILEDRPLLMLDEWAADQDPSYRRMFYHELLPELRALGKTIICVSHDDRYFALADRVIQMDGGRIASLRPGATHDAGYEHTAP